jgi:hypothetical protein
MMNQFEKIGIFIVRVFALMSTLMGAVGIIYASIEAGSREIGIELSRPGQFAASLMYLIVGLVLFALSGRIGHFLSKGLD